MTKESMEALIDAGLDIGVAIKGREEYSGRGMNGKTTCAVVADRVVDIIAVAAQAGWAWRDGREEDDREIVDDLSGLRLDSMGTGVVVY